jgi:hypothetical protein
VTVHTLSRRACLAALSTVGLIASDASDAFAEPLPANLQGELIVKLAPYDKALPARAGDQLVVVIVSKPNDTETDHWALVLQTTLRQTSRIAGLPHTEIVVPYRGAADLARRCREQRASMVVIPSAIGHDVEAIRVAFEGMNVLTVAPEADLVRRGIVLGFEVFSGKPKLFFNLLQARRQNVSMSADVLKLMTVYQ